jgi:Flp pilus assembly protein TadD
MITKIFSSIAFIALSTIWISCGSSSKNEQKKQEPITEASRPAVELEKSNSIDKANSSSKNIKANSSAEPNEGSGLEKLKADLLAAEAENNENKIFKSATSILLLNNQDSLALYSLGGYYQRKNKPEAAKVLFNKLIRQNVKVSEVYNSLGLIELRAGEKKSALTLFRKAVEVRSTNAAAAINAGNLYLEHKDYSKAVTAYEFANLKTSRDFRLLSNYAMALMGSGKTTESEKIVKEALAISNSDKNVMLNYAILLVDHLKKYQEGLDQISRLRFLGPSSDMRERMNVLENKAKAGLNKS